PFVGYNTLYTKSNTVISVAKQFYIGRMLPSLKIGNKLNNKGIADFWKYINRLIYIKLLRQQLFNFTDQFRFNFIWELGVKIIGICAKQHLSYHPKHLFFHFVVKFCFGSK